MSLLVRRMESRKRLKKHQPLISSLSWTLAERPPRLSSAPSIETACPGPARASDDAIMSRFMELRIIYFREPQSGRSRPKNQKSTC